MSLLTIQYIIIALACVLRFSRQVHLRLCSMAVILYDWLIWSGLNLAFLANAHQRQIKDRIKIQI